MVSIDGGLIGNRVLGLIVASVENTSDFSRSDASVVILEILEIMGNPATVDEDATLLTLLIQVSEERSNDFNTLFIVVHLLNLNLLGVIEDSSDLDLLEGVIALELFEILAWLAPNETRSVLGSDINGSLSKKRCPIIIKGINQIHSLSMIVFLPSLRLVLLVELATQLELVALVSQN